MFMFFIYLSKIQMYCVTAGRIIVLSHFDKILSSIHPLYSVGKKIATHPLTKIAVFSLFYIIYTYIFCIF